MITSANTSFFWLTPKGIFSNEPTLYLPITVSSNASLNLLLFLSVTAPMVSSHIWPIFSSRVMPLSSFSIFPSISGSDGMAGTGCLSAQAEKMLPNNKVVNSFFMVICIYLNCKFSIYGLTNRYFLQSAFFICLPLNMTLSNTTFRKGNSRLTLRT